MCWLFFLKDLFISIKSLKPFLLNFIWIFQIWVYKNRLQYSNGGCRDFISYSVHQLLCVIPCSFSWDGIEVEGPGYVSSWSSKDPQQYHREQKYEPPNLQCNSCLFMFIVYCLFTSLTIWIKATIRLRLPAVLFIDLPPATDSTLGNALYLVKWIKPKERRNAWRYEESQDDDVLEIRKNWNWTKRPQCPSEMCYGQNIEK